MKCLSKIFIFSVFILLLSLTATAQKEWLGTYVFEEDGGKTAGGTAIFIEHRIDINESDDGLLAAIESDGYQTARELVGTTRIEGGKLLIFFNSYGENNILEPYKKGDLLLTLERRTEQGKTEILTYWGKFQPVVPKNEKTGKVYFQKSAEE
ncbi:MAG TPA: DUF5991 domain-containing protein [Pyrinomonadaceae bacterium]|jgi:hypothetical protein|nr:DUF5991 domain-containing protein [Pyrinomonadaceae bacterium]